ncbi:MAG: response regulator transcription factor [Campylobacterota bacterium]|nr:response regulator transcription factor [Campylobacterota bacterium]
MSAKILLLEDDLLFGESLQDFLEEEGYAITLCRNGQEALERTYEAQFDLYLLDINVPLVNGLELLGDLRRADDQTPAIYLTSHQDKETMTEGFENGADDYLKKPVDMDELLLRISALLRRTKGKATKCIGELCLDEAHKSITRSGELLNLTLKEYQLLALLMKNAGSVVTKEMIITTLWSVSEEVSDGAVRVYINRLKSELGAEHIENIRGIGYRLVT